ncbi:hypothetical protein VTL71DRAFT_5469 [Oculimacula yallundae]|uniref:Uncharacterized protein n=1 Tax=Oculimacula yallundae TaxID=86028 RepID=A0ABR4C2U9_9HELO
MKQTGIYSRVKDADEDGCAAYAPDITPKARGYEQGSVPAQSIQHPVPLNRDVMIGCGYNFPPASWSRRYGSHQAQTALNQTVGILGGPLTKSRYEFEHQVQGAVCGPDGYTHAITACQSPYASGGLASWGRRQTETEEITKLGMPKRTQPIGEEYE